MTPKTVEEAAQLPPFLKMQEERLHSALEKLKEARETSMQVEEKLIDAVRLLREEITSRAAGGAGG